MAWGEEWHRASWGGDNGSKNERCLRTSLLKLFLYGGWGEGLPGADATSLLGSGSAIWLYSEARLPLQQIYHSVQEGAGPVLLLALLGKTKSFSGRAKVRSWRPRGNAGALPEADLCSVNMEESRLHRVRDALVDPVIKSCVKLHLE